MPPGEALVTMTLRAELERVRDSRIKSDSGVRAAEEEAEDVSTPAPVRAGIRAEEAEDAQVRQAEQEAQDRFASQVQAVGDTVPITRPARIQVEITEAEEEEDTRLLEGVSKPEQRALRESL